jgi:NOL1/NOP2/sun family putative RNA methylase
MTIEFFRKRYEAIGGKIETIAIPKSIRVNTLKISNEELLKRLTSKGVKLTKIPFVKNGYYTESKFSLGATPEYLLGLYQMQEAASQLPAEVLSPKDTDLVLDMCAAPGIKTTHMAQLMGNKGQIVALELKEERIPSMANNLERMGITNTIIYKMNGTDVGRLGLKFSRILLDAPCSGNYAADKDWFEKRDLDGISRNAGLQRELLEAAAGVLEEGGTLVYSTCSLEPEEDEDNIRYAVETLGLKLESTGIAFGDSIYETTKRFWPHKTKTQGFFIAKLRK